MEVINITEETGRYYPLVDMINVNGILVKKLMNFDDIYEPVKRLGSGSFGTVTSYKERSTGNLYALKEITIDPIIIQSIQDEINVLQRLSRDNKSIVQYYDSFVYEKGDVPTYVIVTEYIEGFTLQKYVDELTKFGREAPSLFVFNFALWLFKTLAYIHSVGYVHRDIKPDNIMIDAKSKRFVMIDFGLTCAVNNKLKSICNYQELAGSAAFIAPERWNKTSLENFSDGRSLIETLTNDISIMKKGDIWSAGITVYLVLERTIPWSGQLMHDIMEQIQSPTYAIFYSARRNNLDYYIKEILHMAINKNPNQRSSAEQIVRRMLDITHKIDTTTPPIINTTYSPSKPPLFVSSYVANSASVIPINNNPRVRALPGNGPMVPINNNPMVPINNNPMIPINNNPIIPINSLVPINNNSTIPINNTLIPINNTLIPIKPR